MGLGTETISLEGYIHPTFRGGIGQLEAMRQMAGQGQPLILVDGLGNILGKWVITQVEEGQNTFIPGGIPLEMTFYLTLQKYGED